MKVELRQFRDKLKTHGLLRTLLYSGKFVLDPWLGKFWKIKIRHSYSQCYEDVVIDSILGKKKNGTYLDIGAFDPVHLSNTKRFYDRGWRGCSIEPDPARYQRFVEQRSGDCNLNVGVSDENGSLMFYDLVPGILATFDENRAKELMQKGYKLNKKIEVKVITLTEVFTKYLNREVDFCTLDAEGMDLRILKSNDWTRFRPKVLCVEAAEASPEEFLKTVGYKKVHSTSLFGMPHNEIFVSN